MKKKWYKRIFAGILALALTATSFSGDIENLVHAYGTDNSPIWGGYLEGSYPGSDYSNPNSIKFELCNYSEDIAASISYTLVAEQSGVSKYTYSGSCTIPVATSSGPGRSGDITVPLTSASPSFSLSSSEALDVSLTITSANVETENIGYYSGAGKWFEVVLDSDSSDNGSYSVYLPDTSATLFVGDTYAAPVTITNGYSRSISTCTSSDSSVATASYSGGELTVTAVAAGTANITVGTTTKTTVLPVTVVSATASATSGDYNGSKHNPYLTVKGNNLYPTWNGNMIDAGTYEGEYQYPTGTTRKATYTINPIDLSTESVDTSAVRVNNSGVVSGTITVKGMSVGVNSGYGIDAIATYKGQDGSGAGKYSIFDVTISGSGNFTGKYVATGLQAPINSTDPIDISGKLSVSVSRYPGYTFTGEEIKPGINTANTSDLTVKLGATTLTLGASETVGYGYPLSDGTETVAYATFSDNVNAGDATVTVTGNINAGYTGSKSAAFEIDPLDISGLTISLPSPSETYTGNKIEPPVTVQNATKTFTQGVDYDVEYLNNVEIGTAKVYITGKGNLEGMALQTFKIIGTIPMATILLNGVPASEFSADYTGANIEPAVTGYIGKASNRIQEGSTKDFTVAYTNNLNAGTATVTITGQNKYADQTKTVTFTINKINLPDKLTVTSATREFTGSEIRLNSSEFSIPGLTYGQDYTGETFSNNINAGMATVTVKGMGNYTGTASTTYRISARDLEKAFNDGDATVTVNGGSAVTYTGNKVTPPVVVTLFGNVLDSSNYDVQYYNNQNVGSGAQAIVVTKGTNVIGRITKTFQIKGKTLADCTITFNNTPVTFNYKGNPTDGVCTFETEYTGYYAPQNIVVRDGGTIIPVGQYGPVTSSSDTINVHLSGGVLERNKNYIVIKGKDGGMFDGSQVKIYFTITPRDIKNVEDSRWHVSSTTTTVGGKIRPATISATDKPKDKTYVLTEDTHFTVEIPDEATKPGEYTAKIHGKGSYWDGDDNLPKTISYTVGEKITDLDIRLYPGDASTDAQEFKTKVGDVIQTDFLGRHPAVKVFAGGTQVANPTAEFDYVWSSDNYTADGLTRTLTVKAKSTSANYFGEKTIKYTINPITLETLQAQGVLQLVADTGEKSAKSGSDDKLEIKYDGNAHILNTFKLQRLEAQGSSEVVYTFKPTDVTYSLNQVGPNYTEDPAQTNLTVTAIGSNYSGTANFIVKIKKRPITASGITFTPEYTTATYTGSALEPKITVKDGTKTLEKDVDYTVSYSNNTDAGTATWTVKGKGNYDETTSQNGTFTIGKIDVSKFRVAFDVEEVTFDGTKQEPGFTLYYNEAPLSNSDFDVVYSNNINPGKAQLHIAAKSGDPKYQGSQNFYFNIVCDLSDGQVTVKPGIPKDTITISPSATMDDIAKELGIKDSSFLKFTPKKADGTDDTTINLIYGKDYQLRSFIPTLGERKIYIDGVKDGKFNGYLEHTVKIKGEIDDVKVVDRNPEEYYTGLPIDHSDSIDVSWGGKTLVRDKDYTLTGMTNTTVGEKNYSIVAKNIAGVSEIWDTTKPDTKTSQDGKALSYKIVYNLNDMTVQLLGLETESTAKGTVYFSPYTGTTVKPSGVQLQIGDNLVSGITKDKDYIIDYNPVDPKVPGKVVVTILPATGPTSRGLTVGSASATYEIRGVKLSRVDVQSTSKIFDYDGEIHTPDIKVYDEKSNEVPASNYVVTYYDSQGQALTNCINAGTYYAVATGIDGYTGTTGKTDVSAQFVIKPYDINETGHFNNGPTFVAGNISALVNDTPVFTGSPLEPTVVVEYHTSPSTARTLKKDQDYKITFPEPSKNIDVCTYEAYKAYFVLEGLGNFEGTHTCYFAIDPAEIRNIVLEKKEAPYTGKDINLSSDSILQVKDDKGNPLRWNVDFTVSPLTVKNKGTYNITITGKGNYKNEDTTVDIHGDPLEFTVTARNFEDTYIEVKLGGENTNVTADGEVSEWSTEKYTTAPAVEVVDKFETGPADDKTLVEGKDYDIVGFFNTNTTSADGSKCDPAVTPYVEIKAHEGSDYEGSKKVFFSIGKPFSGAYIERTAYLSSYSPIYNGQPQSPADSKIIVHASDGTTIPRSGTQGGYSVSWYDAATGKPDLTSAGTKNILVTGNNNYFGTIDKDNATPIPQVISYTIEPKTVGPNDVEITLPGLVKDTDGAYIAYWTGEAITPTVKVWDKTLKRALVEGVDYDVQYGDGLVDNINVTPTGGTPVTITIKTKGNYQNGSEDPTTKLKIKPVQIDMKNIEVKWTNYVPDVGDNVVDWDDSTSPLVPPYAVTYTDDAGNATILKQELGDYTVSYRYLDADGNYVNYGDSDFGWYAGEMELVVIGGGNYSGIVTKPYYIRADLGDSDLHDHPENYLDPATITEPFYTGDIPILENLAMKFASKDNLKLPSSADKIDSPSGTVVWQNDYFRIEFDNDMDDDNQTGHMKLTSRNNKIYYGTFEYRFSTETNINAIKFKEFKNSYPYTGAPVNLEYTLETAGGSAVSKNIVKSIAFTTPTGVEVTPIEVGEYKATVTVEIDGQTKDLPTQTFWISSVDFGLTVPNIICTDPQTYTGGKIEPSVMVYLGRYKLTEGTDYDVVYGDADHDNKTPVDYTDAHSGADTGIITIVGKGNYTDTVSRTFEINPASPKHLVVDNQQSTKLRVGWVRNENVGEWIVECRANSASAEPVVKLTGISPQNNFAEIEGLIPGTQYYITVYSKAEGKTGEAMTISDSSARTTVADISGVNATVNGNTVAIGWTPVPNASGYEIIRSTDINQNYRLVASFPASFGGWTNSNLKPGIYYFKVRAYSVDANKVVTYGGYCNPVKVVIQ